MANYVRGEGNRNAKIFICGEAPGYYDDLYKVPFYPSAPSGAEMDWLLSENNLSRSDVYFSNVLKFRPPANKWKDYKETNPSMETSVNDLWSEIEMIKPNIIVAVGEKTLQTLCGPNKKMRHYRGSILESTKCFPKVLPMYSPSIYLHEKDSVGRKPFPYIWKYITLFDFTRAVKESKTSAITRPYRLLTIAKDYADVYRFLEENKHKKYVSIDIEARNCFPFCIALSFSPDRAISIPLFGSIRDQITSINYRDLARIWKLLGERLPNFETIGQNFKYDQDKLEKLGFTFGPLFIDTLLLGHTLNPEWPIKKLEFWTSLYTEEPYYKDEGSGYNPKKDKIDRVLLYNAKDAAVTFEVAMAMMKEAKDEGLWDYYYNRKRPLHDWYLRIENRGFALNKKQRRKIYKKYRLLEEENNRLLEGIIGRKVNISSNPQIHEILFGTLNLPYRKKADEDTLVALLANHCKKPFQAEFIEGLLDGRRIKKTIRTYIKAKPDYDGRMRTSFNIVGTVTGRSSTRKLKPPIRPLYPTGTKKKGKVVGLAFHTLTKHGKLGPDLRSMFTPDEGMVIWEVDKKQAEAYVVFLLGEDYEMLELLKNPEYDIHTETTLLCQIATSYAEAKKKDPRFIGKTIRHMGAYDAHKNKVMKEINSGAKRFGLKVKVSEWKAGTFLDKFHKLSPRIRGTFHPSVREALEVNNKCLTNPFGMRIRFHDRWDEDLFKAAYAWIPQSTIPESVRVAALELEKTYHKDLGIVIEAHDALIGQCKPDEAVDIINTVSTEFAKPIDFSGCSIVRGMLSIPAEGSIYVKSYDPHDVLSVENFLAQL